MKTLDAESGVFGDFGDMDDPYAAYDAYMKSMPTHYYEEADTPLDSPTSPREFEPNNDTQPKEDIQPETNKEEPKPRRPRPRKNPKAAEASKRRPKVKQSEAERKRVHRAACDRWHAKWVSKGVPRDAAAPVPTTKATSSASTQASAASPETQIAQGKKDRGNGKKAVKKEQGNKKIYGKRRDLRTVKFEYIREFLAKYDSPEPETKQQRMTKANKSWMQSTLRAELMSKPGKQTL